MVKNILLIGFGGGIGSIARYLLQKWVYHIYPHPFPWGTFLVNIIGCFLIGVFYGVAEKSNLLNYEWRLLLTAGFCGGFTTFSTFAFENMTFLRGGDVTYFLLYIGLSVILGIAAVFGGIAVMKLL